MMKLHLAALLCPLLLLVPNRAAGQEEEGMRAVPETFAGLGVAIFDGIEEDVVVSVVDALVRPVALSTKLGERCGREFPLDWQASPQVFIIPAASDAWGDSSQCLVQQGKATAIGTAAFEVKRPGNYVAVLLAPGAPAVIKPFHYKGGDLPSVLSMRSPAPGPMGAVTVDVRNPDGGAHHSNIDLYVLDGTTGTPLLARESGAWLDASSKGEWPPSFDLPVGEYLLVARASPPRGYHGTVRAKRSHGDARVPFDVRDGETTKLVVPLAEPAYLEVQLSGEACAADVAEVQHSLEGGGVVMFSPVEEAAKVVSLRLHRELGYPQPIEFIRFAYANTSAAGQHIMPSLVLDEAPVTWISEALPAGSYKLEARLAGGRVLFRDVVLTKGETVKVELDFGSSQAND